MVRLQGGGDGRGDVVDRLGAVDVHLLAAFGAVSDVLAEDVAAGDVLDAVAISQTGGLRPLARARWGEKEDSHGGEANAGGGSFSWPARLPRRWSLCGGGCAAGGGER